MANKQNVMVHLKSGDVPYYNAFWRTFKWGVAIFKRVGKGNMKGNKAIAKYNWAQLSSKKPRYEAF